MRKQRPFKRRKDPELPAEIQELRNSISCELARLENMLDNVNMSDRSVGIEFPRGFIRKTSYWMRRWAFVQNRDLLTDLAYRAQAHDCLRWLINRFDIDLSVLIVVVFMSIVLIASICEGLCYAACSQEIKRRKINQVMPKKLKGLINMLHQTLHIIDKNLAQELHNLRKLRNNLHTYNSVFSNKVLHPPFGSDLEEQAIELLHKHNEAIKTYEKLVDTLERHFSNRGF